MTEQQVSIRSSKRSYVWAAATILLIAADMLIHGVKFYNIFSAMLSIAFTIAMYLGRRSQAWVIAYYQSLTPRTGRPNKIPIAMRYDYLTLLDRALWALWFLLVASTLMLRMSGRFDLSDRVNIGMIALAVTVSSVKVFIAAALFWPGSNDRRSDSA